MTRRGRRLALIGTALAIFGLGVGLMLYGLGLKGSTVFFYGPTEIVEKHIPAGKRMRLGGLVQPGSVVRSADKKVSFAVTDGPTTISVSYDLSLYEPLPDLFREGQGVVAEGVLETPNLFRADRVLAKHDERYMPREVVDALKKQGRWQEGAAKP